MEFKIPARPPVRNRGLRGRSFIRGVRGLQQNTNTRDEVPFITINKVKRSRSRSRGRNIRNDDNGTNFDVTTDSDRVSEEEILETSEKHKIKRQTVKYDYQRPSTSKQDNINTKVIEKDKNEMNKSEFKEDILNSNTSVEENDNTKETYSKILRKDLQATRSEEERKSGKYNDSRADFFIKKAVWFTRDKTMDLIEYINGINNVIGENKITDLQMLNYNKVEIYIKTEEDATKLALEGIVIDNKKIRIFHMVKHPIRIFISGIKPWIQDKEIIYAFKDLGYVEQDKLDNMFYSGPKNNFKINNGTKIMNICRRPEVPIPKTLNLHINGDVHLLSLTPEYILCHNCDGPGHIIKNCLMPQKKVTEMLNYKVNFPKLNTERKDDINIESEDEKLKKMEQSKNKTNGNKKDQDKIDISVHKVLMLNDEEKKENHLEPLKHKDKQKLQYNNTGNLSITEVNNDNRIISKIEDELEEVLSIHNQNGISEEQDTMSSYARQLFNSEMKVIDNSIEIQKGLENNNQQLRKSSSEIQDIENENGKIVVNKVNEAGNKEEYKNTNNNASEKSFSELMQFKDLEEKIEEQILNIKGDSSKVKEKRRNKRTRKKIRLEGNEKEERIHELSSSNDDTNDDSLHTNDDSLQDNETEMELDESITYERVDVIIPHIDEEKEDDTPKQDDEVNASSGEEERVIEQNENLHYMEEWMKVSQNKSDMLVIIKNDENRDNENERDEEEVCNPKSKKHKVQINVNRWETYEPILSDQTNLFKFFRILEEAYKNRKAKRKTFTDQAMNTFKLQELIQSVIDYAEIYDSFGKLGDIHNMIKAKLIYDKEVRNKMMKQKISAINIATTLGYPMDVEVTLNKMKYWITRNEGIEAPLDRNYYDEINKIEHYIQHKVENDEFPEDDMKKEHYMILGKTIENNINYLRKTYKLRMAINRMTVSHLGTKIIEKWDLRTKEKINKLIDVNEFKDLNIVQKKLIQGFKK